MTTIESSASILAALSRIVGERYVLTEPGAMTPFLEEQRGTFHGEAQAVVMPASAEECAEIVKLCAAARLPIVPQGGNTGLCGGAVGQGGIILSTRRMNRIRAIDPVNYTMTVDAGCVLADIKAAAAEADCLFPLSLGAQGSCQIGGNIAANAGGLNVVKYGVTREHVLGLEAVLPDGRIWNGLKALGKDNTGYALKHLFIGAEGTLGIITGAVLKLFPKPVATETAFCALKDLDSAPAFLRHARALSGDAITAFEVIPRNGIDLCLTYIDGVRDPFDPPYDWYALIELSTPSREIALRPIFEKMLETAFEEGLVVDAAIAESLTQAQDFWNIREGMNESQVRHGKSIKHDVSVPVSDVPAFIRAANAAVSKEMPGVRILSYGHLGDGNVHYNLSRPVDMDEATFVTHRPRMNRAVHDVVQAFNGSISAEHGIGLLKSKELAHYKSPEEMDMMRAIKKALDPNNIMNPGKVLDPFPPEAI